MITANMKTYDYYLLGNDDGYGQPQISPEKVGKINLSIAVLTKNVADNIKFVNASYLGLTFENITDKYVIQYGDVKLKVLYVIDAGRMKQVFLGDL